MLKPVEWKLTGELKGSLFDKKAGTTGRRESVKLKGLITESAAARRVHRHCLVQHSSETLKLETPFLLDAVLRCGRDDCRRVRDARWHHHGLTAELRDRERRADNQKRVDQGFKSAALFFLRAHKKRVGGFKCLRIKCLRISRDCFHSFLSMRCSNPAVRIQGFRENYDVRRPH